jgi:hypothetical protein
MTALSDETDTSEGDRFPPLEQVQPEHAGSILDTARAQREQIARSKFEPIVLDVPDGVLGLRCEYPQTGYRTLNDAAERAAASGDRDAVLNANADVILACCVEVVGRKDPGDTWESLLPGGVSIGPRLADALGIAVSPEVKSPARFILRHVFSPRAATTGVYDGDLALLAAGDELVSQLRSGQRRTSEQFVGE